MNHPLDILQQTISGRQGADPSISYTASLFKRGVPTIARKVGEEATETVVEALSGTPETVAAESADLLYHLLVLWTATGVDPGDVWRKLERRAGVSGFEERSRRGVSNDPKGR
ncbi:MAG: phosphoribosyl-ATP diphosphatase [Rhodospirillaceae bacterium]|nr:phosphoribosyl-ATP diphosphatase [Rhodospirillaceae bacterium]|tara:strand:- start:150 stop:488 length:339 start_codon:yes stop_codon:yes gene_type:complete